jgi:Holliday junction resolvasome RuvABC ATP-dependent DNA helicase subunit
LKVGSGKPKKWIELNCASIKNLNQFFTQIVVPHLTDCDATILFDECSELPKDVTMALLTILNPNKEYRTEFFYDDYMFECDFRKLTFLFATTEAQDVFHALMDRLDRVDLEDYSIDELSEIVKLNVPSIKFNGDVLSRMSETLRGNARGAQKISMKIMNYCAANKKKTFTVKDWHFFSAELDILPLGLNRIEYRIMQVLSEEKATRLTKLSAKIGLSKACLQRDFEMYLQKMSLIEITPEGRSVTTQGQSYLKETREILSKR